MKRSRSWRVRRRAGAAPGQAELPLPGQAVRQADAGGRRGGRARSAPGSSARLGAGRAGHARRGRRSARRILPEDVAVERDVASDWLVQSDGPYVAALDPRLDRGAPAGGTGPGAGEPGPASPQGCRATCTPTGSGSGSTAASRCCEARPEPRRRTSGRDAGPPAGARSGGRRRRDLRAGEFEIDGYTAVIGGEKQRSPGRPATGPVHNPWTGNDQEAARRTSRSGCSRSGRA